MRTTVEMKPEHRVALRAIASRRGHKGLSSVLGEAIENYLHSEEDRAKRRELIGSLAGSLSKEEADHLRRSVLNIRNNWR